MTKKQKRFVEEYLIDLNATQAAIRAGYKAKNGQRASEIGHELLQKTQVSEAISEAIAERSKRTGINADRVLLELARIAFVNADDVINAKDATLQLMILDITWQYIRNSGKSAIGLWMGCAGALAVFSPGFLPRG